MQASHPTGRRAVLRAAGASMAALALPMAARAAADWPSKPVYLVVPFPAGGGTDAFARPFSAQFAKSAGKFMLRPKTAFSRRQFIAASTAAAATWTGAVRAQDAGGTIVLGQSCPMTGPAAQ